jgi:hypothetical protein
MIISKKLIRNAIRDALQEADDLKCLREDDVPSETKFEDTPYDRQAARSFNDPNTFPDEIAGLCDEISKIMRLPDPSATHSLSGRANPNDTAVALRIRSIKKLAKELAEALSKNPVK